MRPRLSEKSQVTEKPQTFFSNHNSYGSCKNTLVRRSSQKEQVFHGICIQYYTIERKNSVISDPVVCIDLQYFFFSLLQKKKIYPFRTCFLMRCVQSISLETVKLCHIHILGQFWTAKRLQWRLSGDTNCILKRLQH